MKNTSSIAAMMKMRFLEGVSGISWTCLASFLRCGFLSDRGLRRLRVFFLLMLKDICLPNSCPRSRLLRRPQQKSRPPGRRSSRSLTKQTLEKLPCTSKAKVRPLCTLMQRQIFQSRSRAILLECLSPACRRWDPPKESPLPATRRAKMKALLQALLIRLRQQDSAEKMSLTAAPVTAQAKMPVRATARTKADVRSKTVEI